MAIASGVYNDIPSDLRIPGVFIEFDARLANSGVWQTKLLILGQRLEVGEKDALSVDRVTSGDQADRYYGRGSMLAEMLRSERGGANITVGGRPTPKRRRIFEPSSPIWIDEVPSRMRSSSTVSSSRSVVGRTSM